MAGGVEEGDLRELALSLRVRDGDGVGPDVLGDAASFTRGGLGMLIKADQRPINFQFKDPVWIYYIALGLCAISLLIAWWLTRSRFGARLVAIRENEDAARALGISPRTLRYKLAKIKAKSDTGAVASGFNTPVAYALGG